MAKAGASKAAKAEAIPTVVMDVPKDTMDLQQVFKVSEDTSEADIVRADGMPGVRIEFDFVHFKKLSDDFVSGLKAPNQKAYWIAQGEWDSRVRQANIALHSIDGGVDPLSKILDRPRGRSNPLTRDGERVQKILGKDWYVTWRVQGGEGDITNALEAGFKIIRHPKDEEEEKAKSPFDWTGDIWKIRDGTADKTSGDEISNVMVVIRRKVWDDNLKAMSMASHNGYRQNKMQFREGMENISRDMLGGREKVIAPEYDLDDIREEEHNGIKELRRVRK